MNIDKIDGLNSIIHFKALKGISCHSEGLFSKPSLIEKRIADELKNIAQRDKFFEKYDVNAFVKAYDGIASLKLNFKPVANNFKEKFRNFFMPAKLIELEKRAICTHDSSFFLVKEIRQTKTFDFHENTLGNKNL